MGWWWVGVQSHFCDKLNFSYVRLNWVVVESGLWKYRKIYDIIRQYCRITLEHPWISNYITIYLQSWSSSSLLDNNEQIIWVIAELSLLKIIKIFTFWLTTRIVWMHFFPSQNIHFQNLFVPSDLECVSWCPDSSICIQLVVTQHRVSKTLWMISVAVGKWHREHSQSYQRDGVVTRVISVYTVYSVATRVNVYTGCLKQLSW